MKNLPLTTVKIKHNMVYVCLGRRMLRSYRSYAQADAAVAAMKQLLNLLVEDGHLTHIPDFGEIEYPNQNRNPNPDRGVRKLGNKWWVTSPKGIPGGFPTKEAALKARAENLASRPTSRPEAPTSLRSPKSKPAPHKQA